MYIYCIQNAKEQRSNNTACPQEPYTGQKHNDIIRRYEAECYSKTTGIIVRRESNIFANLIAVFGSLYGNLSSPVRI